MSVPITASWDYPVNPHQMFLMLTDLRHLEAKAERLGHAGYRIAELRERDGLFHSTAIRLVDVDLPTWARWLTSRIQIVQSQAWEPATPNGGRTYRTTTAVTGLAIQVTGRGWLAPVDFSTTRYRIDLEVCGTGHVLRKRLESFVADQFEEVINTEHDFRLEWLDRKLGIGR
jgi:hypothetical protein